MNDEFENALINSEPRSEQFSEEHNCPRGIEAGGGGRAVWGVDNCCSYCGSLHPSVLMARLEAGTVSVDPTDKDYKIYVHANDSTELFKQSFRGDDCPGGKDPSKWKWTTREMRQTKFYFQHLSKEEKQRFVALLNEKRIKLNDPGYFYVMPFFIQQ